MKCPKCGSDLDTGFNCTKCDYKHNQKRLSTAEKLIVIKTELKKLPKGCFECPEKGIIRCRRTMELIATHLEPFSVRPEWCPLMEIKESK